MTAVASTSTRCSGTSSAATSISVADATGVTPSFAEARSIPSRSWGVLSGVQSTTSGTFKGLKEGAKVKLGKTKYQITYRGGDGNDVALTSDTPSPSATSRTTPLASGAAPKSATTANASDEGSIPLAGWVAAAVLGGLAALMVPVSRRWRTRTGRRGGRHAA
jgi:hypothetical protein